MGWICEGMGGDSDESEEMGEDVDESVRVWG